MMAFCYFTAVDPVYPALSQAPHLESTCRRQGCGADFSVEYRTVGRIPLSQIVYPEIANTYRVSLIEQLFWGDSDALCSKRRSNQSRQISGCGLLLYEKPDTSCKRQDCSRIQPPSCYVSKVQLVCSPHTHHQRSQNSHERTA
jgi:hypothetical protein